MSFDFVDMKFGRRKPEPEPEPEPERVCSSCEGGGWEYYGLGWGDPHFRVCRECLNPEGLPCP